MSVRVIAILKITSKRFPWISHTRDWTRDFLEDFGLYLLAITGYAPSHSYRKFVYRLFGLKIPASSSLHWRARFFHPEKIQVGEFSTIGNDAFLDGREGLIIGNCVNISGEVRIFTREHDIDDPYFSEKGGRVLIDDYAYLGTRVTILPGCRIGYGAVVASGAVVTGDVPEFTVYGGVPARYIRNRSHNLHYKLGYAKRFQ
jgi:maltose O-acetyltransferase